MARAGKGARSITVNDVPYRGRASSQDDFVAATVRPHGSCGRTVTARLYDGGYDGENPAGRNHQSPRTLVVTNRLVRRIIELARSAHNYVPSSRGSPVALGDVGGRIELGDAIVADNKHW